MKWDKDANKLLGTELTEFLGNHGITVTYAEKEGDVLNLELGFYTNLDEPFRMDITCEGKEDFSRAFRAFMRDFSPEDYAKKQYGKGCFINDIPVPHREPLYRELLTVADAVHSFLDKTASELETMLGVDYQDREAAEPEENWASDLGEEIVDILENNGISIIDIVKEDGVMVVAMEFETERIGAVISIEITCANAEEFADEFEAYVNDFDVDWCECRLVEYYCGRYDEHLLHEEATSVQHFLESVSGQLHGKEAYITVKMEVDLTESELDILEKAGIDSSELHEAVHAFIRNLAEEQKEATKSKPKETNGHELD